MINPSFSSTKVVPFQPIERISQNQLATAGVPTSKLNIPWKSFDNAVTSLFGVARTFAGAETIETVPTAPNAAFYIGTAGTDARYIKQNQLVTLYVRFTIGSNTKINDLVEDAMGATQGNVGVMAINLPFPAAPGQPYALGTVGYTATTQDVTNALTHTEFSSFLWTQPLDAGARLIYLLSNPVWTYLPPAPPVYNANGFQYWSPGDYMEVVFEYETDYDG